MILYIYLIFFFNDTATTEIYTLSLHDALPISRRSAHSILGSAWLLRRGAAGAARRGRALDSAMRITRSEEHTSELQSRQYLVCRLLLEKKKKIHTYHPLLFSLTLLFYIQTINP